MPQNDVIVCLERDGHHIVILHVDPLHNELHQLVLFLRVAIAGSPVVTKILQNIRCPFQVIFRNRHELLKLLLQTHTLFQIVVFVGDEALIPAEIHTLDGFSDRREPLVQTLLAQQSRNGLRHAISPVGGRHQAHQGVDHLRIHRVALDRTLLTLVVEVPRAAPIVVKLII
ncbi:MAG: hypothetical protein IPK19_31200 [Chloroflexi bacterium]|nr:hypothetical protein [Chloroflexota bacterium]